MGNTKSSSNSNSTQSDTMNEKVPELLRIFRENSNIDPFTRFRNMIQQFKVLNIFENTKAFVNGLSIPSDLKTHAIQHLVILESEFHMFVKLVYEKKTFYDTKNNKLLDLDSNNDTSENWEMVIKKLCYFTKEISQEKKDLQRFHLQIQEVITD